MTLTVPPGVFPEMTDEELADALETTAERVCGGFLGNYHKLTEIARLSSVLDHLTPETYALMWRTYHKDRT